MPQRRSVWSSWNYCLPAGQQPDPIALTYWMNSLQPIPKDDPLFVTLNPTRAIDPSLVQDQVDFAHPVYDAAAQDGRAAIAAMIFSAPPVPKPPCSISSLTRQPPCAGA